MADQSDQEKTEEATAQRREDFRRRGQVAQTRELSSVFILLGIAICTWMMGQFFLQQVLDIYELSYTSIQPHESGMSVILPLMGSLGLKAFYIMGPIFLMVVFLTSGSSILQVGFLFSEEALTPDINKINPVSGFKRIFSLRSLMEGLKSILKFLFIGGTAYVILKDSADTMPKLLFLGPAEILAYVSSTVFSLIIGIGGLMLVIALVDFLYQKYAMEEQMKMTKQEVKDEVKTREGDPLIKARIRKIQKEVAQKRMMADVPKADVVITNPTHLACALKYDPEKNAAPILIAKGQDLVAKKIREIAKENNIPVVENKPLARTIFKTMELGQVIPRELFAAVAEVLAYVFRMKRKGMVR